jgi:two-component system, sensor histidine kinase PdtaS
MLQHSLLFQFKHGDHTCVFYRSEDSLREVLTPYIADGLRRGERCFLAQKPGVAKQLLFDLRFLGVDVDDAIRRGALDLHSDHEAYSLDRGFEPDAMVEMLLRSIDRAKTNGFTGFRTAGELRWAVEGRNECDQLLTYEELVDQSFPGKPAIGLCQYDLNAFPPDVLKKVMDSHRLNMPERPPKSFHTAISVRGEKCWTEIVADKLVVDPSYYYVVQRRRSTEVLGWGIAPSFDQANANAETIVAQAESLKNPVLH